MGGNIHVIAEAGTNHNGRRETAERLIDVALKARADSVKFQIIYPEGLYLPRVFVGGQYVDNDVYHNRAASMLTDDDYRCLASYCKARGIGFSASVFDERGIALLDELDVSYFKIASCDLNNSGLLRAVAERQRRVVLSTGMATLGEIERAVTDVFSTGNADLVLMHCVSVYPAPIESMNLAFIDTLQTAFGLPVGLSDHTESSLAAAIAVSKGVSWIEKHFTLDRSSRGFDHAYAMEPEPLRQYVSDIRACEMACHLQAQRVKEAEAHVKVRARRGLYAAHTIDEGHVLREGDVLVVRPEGPLGPKDLPQVVGKIAKRKICQFEPLGPDMF